jgi:hypothetical protein
MFSVSNGVGSASVGVMKGKGAQDYSVNVDASVDN